MNDRQKAELAKKSIIEQMCCHVGALSEERKAGLLHMSLDELIPIHEGVKSADSRRSAITIIVNGIVASDRARWEAEQRYTEALVPPATVSMDL